MVVLLVGLIHALYMYLVLRFKLIYKTQTSFVSYLLLLLCISWTSFYFNPQFDNSKMKDDPISKQFQIYSDTNFKRKYICILLFNLHVLLYTRVITIYMKNTLEIDLKQ